MTGYHSAELAEGWEFKILRSAGGEFKRPERMREILSEEAQAGWVLVEKFDNTRVRLKRPAEARRNDAHLPFDPYRTDYGRTENERAMIIVAIVMGLVVGVLLLAFTIASLAR